MDDIHKPHNLDEFFILKIKKSMQIHGFKASPDVEFYLVNLLKQFAVSENFFHKTADGKWEIRPLALQLYDAVFDAPSHRYLHLKKMGDSALYQAGVFYDGLLNKTVDVGYYIAMGRQAYATLAHQKTYSEKNMSDLFCELSDAFPNLVEIVALTCERDEQTDADLLKWLDRYQKTKSQKAKQLLEDKGIFVESLGLDKDMQ